MLYLVWRARFRYPPPAAVQCLCFHKISRQFLWEGTWTTPSRFAAILDRLAREGYEFIDEDAYLGSLDGAPSDASRQLFLTFDDAYSDVYTEAFPILRERTIPFHVFVVSEFAGRENTWDLSLGRPPARHAGWDALAEMIGSGASIGSHSARHADLTRLDDAAVERELGQSRETISRRLGVTPRTFSYPFGRYDARVRAITAASGYEAAFSLYPRHANEHVDRYALRRNGVYIIDPPSAIRAKLEPGPWFWFEEMKCRTINAVAVLTPLLKRVDGA